MERREEAQRESAGWEAQGETVRARKEALEGTIKGIWREIDDEVARQEEKKQGIVPLIPPELMELYEVLRPAKEGVAVGRLAEGICGGCHLALSAAEQAEILRQDPPRCLHCRRILVPQ